MTVARPTLRQEQRDLTRQRITEAARMSFYERGVGETSMEQIARAAGVGRATLYLHFPNKDALLLDLLTTNLRAVRGIFRQLCDLESHDRAKIQAWLSGYVRTLSAHRAAMRLFHVGLANDAQARTLVDDHRDGIIAMMAARFPHLRLEAGGDAQNHARMILLLARIDHFASAAAEEQPRFDIAAGLEIVSEEIVSLLG